MFNNPSPSAVDVNAIQKSLKPVVDDSIISDTPLVDVHVCKIGDKKQISRLIQELNKKFPLPSLQHLKRFFRNEIILYLSSERTEKSFTELDLDTTGLDLNSIRQIKVASVIPKTRKQYDKASPFWPTAFNEDKYLEKLLSGKLFSIKELQEHGVWMREAVKAARRCEPSVGVTVVDPATKTILAIASDGRTSHPMRHAVMVAVDLVARTQGGGVWPVTEGDFVLKDNVEKPFIIHSKRDQEGVEKPVGPYLCTGYDMYVTREPCAMCAMALVHSRVRRVFYGCESSAGALGTLVKLHTLKGLNHHYEVFKGLLLQECSTL